jgi:hypothetical protein
LVEALAWWNPFDQGGEPILQDRNKRHEHRKYSAGSFKFKHPQESSLSDDRTRILIDDVDR